MNEPKVIIECDNTEYKHHDGFHNCKSERIVVTNHTVYRGHEETNYPTCRSVE